MSVKCANHPPADAVTTCSFCSKPLCQQCLFYFEGMIYCSQDCGLKAKSMGVQLRQDLKRGSGFGGFIGWVIRTAIAVAIILALLDFLNINLPFVPHFF